MSDEQGIEGSFELNDVLKILYQALLQNIENPFRILDRDYRLLWINRPETCQEVGRICYENIYQKNRALPGLCCDYGI